MTHDLKICFVANSAYKLFDSDSPTHFGGAEVQLYLLGQYLKTQPSTQVTFLTAGYPPYTHSNIEDIEVYKVLPYIKQSILKKISGVLKLFWFLYKIKADVYIQRALGLETIYLALFCKLFRRKFVYMVANEHEVSGEYADYFGKLGARGTWGMRHATVIIVQNMSQQQVLYNTYGLHGTSISSGYPLPAVTSILPLEQRDFILWVGRCDLVKQPEVVMDLARQFPDEQFIMIIPADDRTELFTHFQKQAQEYKNIKIIPEVQFSKIGKYYQRAKLLLNTSTTEGFPNTFIQAGMYGTPLLSLTVNPENIIEQHELGWWAHGNSSQLITDLQIALTDISLWQLHSKQIRKYVEQSHAIEQTGKLFYELVCKIAS